MRCARQRCRAARGKQTSIALMMPGAPSEVTSSGSFRPRLFMSSKNAITVSVSFFGARHHVQQHTTALNRKTPGRQNRLAFGTRPQTLGDAIDKQIRDLVLAQVPLRERLVILPQPLPKLGHRGLR